MFGKDLLANHRPQTIIRRLAEDGDLIFVMEEKLLNPKVLPPERHSRSNSTSASRHVHDPWPDRPGES